MIMITNNCATIMSGSKQEITITSDPSDADIVYRKTCLGKTPAKIKLKRKEKHAAIRLEKGGYEPVVVNLTRTFNKWYGLNLVSFTIFGLIVDPITGAAYSLDPDEIDVWLQKTSKNKEQNSEKL